MLLENQPSIIPVSVNPFQLAVKSIEQGYVQSVKEGNLKFLFIVYTHYHEALFTIISNIVQDEIVAEDVLQLTMIKVWKFAHQYDATKGRLYTWLRRVATNVAMDYLRSGECIKGGQTKSIHQMVDTLNHYYCDYNSDYTDIKRLVCFLSPVQKQVIKLIYILGYTQLETSRLMAIPLGTVKTHVGKAISTLRKLHLK